MNFISVFLKIGIIRKTQMINRRMVKYIIFMMSIKQLLQVTFSNNMEKMFTG